MGAQQARENSGPLWRQIGLSLLGLGLLLAHNSSPVLLLSWGPANTAVGVFLGIYLVWRPVFLLLRMERWWSLALALVGMAVAVVGTLLVLGVGALTGAAESAGDFSWQGTRVRSILINGGATTDYLLELRQEKAIAPGLLLVKSLGTYYGCAGAEVRPTSAGLQIRHAAMPNSDCRIQPEGEEIRLRRFVYF